MNQNPPARPQPGAPRKVENLTDPRAFKPVDPRPRVPPRGEPFVPRPVHLPPGVPAPRGATVIPSAPVSPQGPATGPREEVTPRSRDGRVLSSAWERVDLPSNFVFYPWDQLNVRRIEPVDHAKVSRAVKAQNLTIMLDVLSSTCDQDVREFCVSDFRALCIWHKYNSYPQGGGVTITWNSRYGGRASSRVKNSRIVENKLQKTRQEYLEWCAKGLATPTMRDMEMLETMTDEDQLALFERAQFIFIGSLKARVAELQALGDAAPTTTARIEELNRRGMAFYATIDQFAEEFADFGVSERVEVVNTKWDPAEAVQALLARGEPGDVSEARQIESQLASGEFPQPKPEEVPLVFNLWGMFPYV